MESDYSDETNPYELSDSEKALLSEVQEAVLSAEAAGQFSAADAGGESEHPAVQFVTRAFPRKCQVQLEVLRSRDVAYSLKELVWFALNLERDQSYLARLNGADCSDAEALAAAASLPQLQHVPAPPEPLLLGDTADDAADAAAQRQPTPIADVLQQLHAAAAATSAKPLPLRLRRSLPHDRPQLTVVVPSLPQLPHPHSH